MHRYALVALSLVGFALVTAAADTRPFSFLDLAGEVPRPWISQAPGSSMRAAELRIPGEPPATLIVYYFGKGQGGTPEANIARWSSQFSAPGGEPVAPDVARFQAAGIPVTLARFEGSYARGVGVGPQGPARPEQMLLAAVLERASGNVIIQLFGPAATVRANEAAFRAFLQGLRVEG